MGAFTLKACLFALAIFITVTQNTAADDPPKPTFGKVFSTEVEVVFPAEGTAADVTIYFDLLGNRAAIDIMYQDEQTRQIYRFSKDELITIKDNFDCSVTKIDNEPFFPYDVDAKGAKTLKPAENMFYFMNSQYEGEELNGFIPIIMYKATAKVAFLENVECEVTHRFTKADFAMPECNFRSCQSSLVSIVATCEQGVTQQYNFFKFKNSIAEDTIFQVPPSVYCPTENDHEFPNISNYASFSYDTTEVIIDTDSFEGTHIQHHSVWYDQDEQILRVDDFDDSGLSTVKIYDFNYEMAYTFISNVQCSYGTISKNLTMEQLTHLPNSLFPEKLQHTTEAPVYSGMRISDGLEYEVWTLQFEDKNAGLKRVTDLYFIQNVLNTNGFVNKIQTQIAFVRTYAFEQDSESQIYKLTTTSYSPINHYRTSPRELTVFGMSNCFNDSQRTVFQLELQGPSIPERSADYTLFIEKVQFQLMQHGNVHLTRIDKLKVAYTYDDIFVFRGVIVDIPVDSEKNIPNRKTVFNSIQTDVAAQNFRIDIGTEEIISYRAIKFSELENIDDCRISKKSDGGYSKSFVGSLAFGMVVLGFVIGIVGLFVYYKFKRVQEVNPYKTMD